MYFTPNRLEIKTFVTKNFITHVRNLLFDSYVIHHLHVTGEIIQMFWEECNFIYLNGKNVIHLHIAEILWKYIEEDEGNIDKMKRKLLEN